MTQQPEIKPILIVDDIPANLSVLSDALTNAGYKVAVATNGDRALKMVKYNPPALILLDVMMPGIDGFETCQRLKENPATQEIPVIFMTALSDTVDKVKGLNLGAVDYITKPFQQEEVLARIRVHLKLRNLTETLAAQNVLLKNLTEDLEARVADRTAELSQSLQKLQQTQLQLVQSEKMSALGQLVAGIAHEINNPVSFISGNISHTSGYVQDLLELLDLYQNKFANPGSEIEEKIEEIELEYLREDLPKLIESMKLGTDRIRHISTSLRTFSRSDSTKKVQFNIHEGIDSTLLILQHRLKANPKRPEIKVVKKYGDIPPISCYAGQINQVFMNLLANAIDAIDEAKRSVAELEVNPHTIIIRTELEGDDTVVIIISDNGLGIPDEIKQKVFEHLFTTKPVGKGTGLGLSISCQIVQEKHGGKLTCTSALGKGTEFAIALPLT
ncbi:MAG: response regulator [Hormoscilla sp.]